MKITLTGAAGNITKPLAETLLAQGHNVTVIGRSAEHLQPLVAQGAQAAVGSLEDVAFLTDAFRGAEAVYTMVPAPFHLADWPAYHEAVAHHFAQAIGANGVSKVVNLSTYGAHRPEGISPTAALARVEKVLNMLESTTVIHLRPGYFYSNLTAQIPSIKARHLLGANYGNSGEQLLLVHPRDIAEVAARALTDPTFPGAAPYYVVSDERTCPDIARALGQAIGQPELPWVQFSDDDYRQGLQQAGLPAALADVYLAIRQDLRHGVLAEHYESLPLKPARGQVKLEDYAPEFAAVYNQSW